MEDFPEYRETDRQTDRNPNTRNNCMQGKNFKICLDLTMITKPHSFKNINRAPQLCQALCWAQDLKEAQGMAPAPELMGSTLPPS